MIRGRTGRGSNPPAGPFVEYAHEITRDAHLLRAEFATLAPMPKRATLRLGPKHDPPPATPPRLIRRQLAMTVRGDHAVLGIGHAGEVLAAVRLSGAEAAAWAVRATEAALALGVAVEEIESAIGDACKQHRAQLRLQRRNQVKLVKRAAKVRAGTCHDCGTGFRHVGKGRVPTRCEPCRLDHARRKGREWYRERVGATARPAAIACQDCGAEVPVQPRGQVPRRCGVCRVRAANRRAPATATGSCRTAVCRDCDEEFRCGSRGIKPGRCPRCLGMLLGS